MLNDKNTNSDFLKSMKLNEVKDFFKDKKDPNVEQAEKYWRELNQKPESLKQEKEEK